MFDSKWQDRDSLNLQLKYKVYVSFWSTIVMNFMYDESPTNAPGVATWTQGLDQDRSSGAVCQRVEPQADTENKTFGKSFFFSWLHATTLPAASLWSLPHYFLSIWWQCWREFLPHNHLCQVFLYLILKWLFFGGGGCARLWHFVSGTVCQAISLSVFHLIFFLSFV